MNKNVKRFLGDAVEYLIDNRVAVDLQRVKRVKLQGDLTSKGYFDLPKKMVMGTAWPLKKWLATFVHEYCHAQQYIEHSRLAWEYDNALGMDKYDDWLEKKADMTKEELTECTRAVQALELDCERRVVRLIYKYNLPLDVDDYIRRANAYVLFYVYVAKHQRWSEKISPDDSPEVVKTVPKYWMIGYNSMPPGYEEAVTKYCFNNKIRKASTEVGG